ncbi:MAG: 3-hydroxyacyl-CoA dehydrogenase [Thermodesulfobacteriota bacterium]
MKLEDIKTILIVGAGTMGQQIGFQCAVCGFDVVMYDLSEDMLETANTRLEQLSNIYISSQRLTEEKAAAAMAKIEMTTDPGAAGEKADFVSESVPEDPELKEKVFAQFHEICPANAIFTTNTSSLIPSMIAEATGRPERFAAFHFHDTRVTQIVDIMPHPGTSPEVLALIEAFAIRIGQIPIVLKKENFGYLFNAMIMELFKSAQTLAANGVASVEDIDRAWMGVMHTSMGPFGIMDSIGIDTVWKLTDYWAKIVKDPQQTKNADFMKTYVDKGKLGEKAGKGFYSYPNPTFSKRGFIANKPESN